MADAGGAHCVIRTLKDGYWERTALVQLASGELRVRKSSNGDSPPGPWGVGALRKEIAYLSSLPARARAAFPPLLAAWDDRSTDPPRVGYEIPYYADHADLGTLARAGTLPQEEIDRFEDALALLLLDCVHRSEPVPCNEAATEPLSAHVATVVEQALGALEADPALAPLIDAPSIRLDGRSRAGLRLAFARLVEDGAALAVLDGEPQVRLHGDLFLENMLWPRASHRRFVERELVLIDPVSVAGIDRGPPLFDLVKYESYATGELVALRGAWIDLGGFDGGGDYDARIRWQRPELAPFRTFDWHTRFRRAFEAQYGPVDERAYRLLDGYFSLAMAVNTGGTQRRARLLKATRDFNAAAG